MKKCKKLLACVAAGLPLVAAVLVAGCTPEQQYAESIGTMCSLEEAYERGLMTQDDILSIAYYYNQGTDGNEELMGENYVPNPIVPETLDEERVYQIKRTYLNDILQKPNESFEHVTIFRFYGIYRDCFVVSIGYVPQDSDIFADVLVIPDYPIGNVIFRYQPFNIKVWCEDR